MHSSVKCSRYLASPFSVMPGTETIFCSSASRDFVPSRPISSSSESPQSCPLPSNQASSTLQTVASPDWPRGKNLGSAIRHLLLLERYLRYPTAPAFVVFRILRVAETVHSPPARQAVERLQVAPPTGLRLRQVGGLTRVGDLYPVAVVERTYLYFALLPRLTQQGREVAVLKG